MKQMKKQKEEQKFRDALQKGDSVVTIGGIYGKIVEIREDGTVLLKIDKENNTVVRISKAAIAGAGDKNTAPAEQK